MLVNADVGSSSLLQLLSDDGFRILLACFITVSSFLFGFGLERGIGRYLVFHATDATAILYYNFIIMSWPILLLIGLLSFSPFGLPFAAMGLFFGGVPLISYDVSLTADTRRNKLARILSAGKVTGNTLHHSSFLLVCSLIVVQQVIPNRSILAVGIPLLVMHFAALFESVSTRIYYGLVLISEVWFQCEMFAYLPVQPTEMKVAYWMMIIAHWVFLSCTAALILVEKSPKKTLVGENAVTNFPAESRLYVIKVTHYFRQASHRTTFKKCDAGLTVEKQNPVISRRSTNYRTPEKIPSLMMRKHSTMRQRLLKCRTIVGYSNVG